jgi:hypothetical protein
MGSDAFQFHVSFNPVALAIKGQCFEIELGGYYSLSPVAYVTGGFVYAFGDIWESADTIIQQITWTNADPY